MLRKYITKWLVIYFEGDTYIMACGDFQAFFWNEKVFQNILAMLGFSFHLLITIEPFET